MAQSREGPLQALQYGNGNGDGGSTSVEEERVLAMAAKGKEIHSPSHTLGGDGGPAFYVSCQAVYVKNTRVAPIQRDHPRHRARASHGRIFIHVRGSVTHHRYIQDSNTDRPASAESRPRSMLDDLIPGPNVGEVCRCRRRNRNPLLPPIASTAWLDYMIVWLQPRSDRQPSEANIIRNRARDDILFSMMRPHWVNCEGNQRLSFRRQYPWQAFYSSANLDG